MNKTPILIVGAGPTGLTLACELARRGVAFRIIERAVTPQIGSRAKGVQPRSLEVFDDLGIVAELMSNGTTEVLFRRYQGSRMIDETKRQTFPRSDTRYPRSLLAPQWKVEEVLRKKLQEYGAAVEFGTELIDFAQNGEGVEATVQKSDGTEQVVCDYLVGCDGGKGSIRKMLGINFVGETHDMERALVGDVEVDGLTPDAWHIWMHPQYGIAFALCPFKCTNSWQLQAVMPPDKDGNMPDPTLETFKRVFLERTGMDHVVLKNATWQSIYRVNVRMADKYRVGNVFIAGDAAHAHSIAGGLGMNTGIQDAYNLGWKLAAVVTNQASAGLLDTYEEERLPVAAWTLNISSERQKAMTDAAAKGTGTLANMATKDTTQLNLNYRNSSLSQNKTAAGGRLAAGDRAPDARLADGSWLFDLYRGPHFTVLGFGNAGLSITAFKAAFPAENVQACYLQDVPAANAFDIQNGLVIIRPDGYIGMITDQNETAINYLRQFMPPGS